MSSKLKLAMFLIALTLPLPAHAADWYAAPDGKASNAGTEAAPWDIATALRDSRIQPGDQVLMKGGTYLGKFTSTIKGTTAAPIVVRSAPGEWAVIDGYRTTTLSQTIDATTRSFAVADMPGFPSGSVVTIDAEQMQLLDVIGGVYTNVQRGWNGTTRASHNAGATVVLGGDNLTVRGADAIYRDFGVQNSDPLRVGGNNQNAARLRGEGVWHGGPRTKLVNLVVHDCQEGIFSHSGAVGGEVYGCVIYNNGFVAGQYNGHGVYAQNNSAAVRKLFAECVVFNNFHMGLKQVSQTGNTVGMDHIGIVSFNNGSPAGDAATRGPAIQVGANEGISDDIAVRDSHLYNPSRAAGHVLRLGFSAANGKAVVTGNRIGGGNQTFSGLKWSDITVTDNIIHVSPGGELVEWTRTTGGAVVWDRNRYATGRVTSPGRFSLPPTYGLDFAAWKSATGYDAASSYQAGPLEPQKVYVRPNAYEAGRAHVIVYNPSLAGSALVDLSTTELAPGQRYEIRNAQNWPSASLAGIYDAAAPVVSLPLSDTRVATPIGHSITPASTLPGFGAFVVVPIGAAPAPVDPNIARAEGELAAFLAWAGSYATGNTAFAARYQAVLDAIRAPR